MKKAVLLFFFLLILAEGAAAQEAAWSKPVNGLRARLLILPSDRRDSPFCRVFIEMQNVSNSGGQMRIRFKPDLIVFEVTDRSGKPLLKPNAVFWDGLVPGWETTQLPWTGTIKFQISFPGAGYRPTDKVVVDMGAGRTWAIPQDGGEYKLSGKLTIARQNGDHPYIDWNGTIELPAVKIPKNK
jgi:hypothetical protein